MSIKNIKYYAEFEKKLIGDGHTLKKKKKKSEKIQKLKLRQKDGQQLLRVHGLSMDPQRKGEKMTN